MKFYPGSLIFGFTVGFVLVNVRGITWQAFLGAIIIIIVRNIGDVIDSYC